MCIAYTASVLWTGYKCMHIWFKITKSNLYLVNRNQLAYALLPTLSLHFQMWLYSKVLWSIFFCVTNSGLWVGWNKLSKVWEVMVHPGQVTYIYIWTPHRKTQIGFKLITSTQVIVLTTTPPWLWTSMLHQGKKIPLKHKEVFKHYFKSSFWYFLL